MRPQQKSEEGKSHSPLVSTALAETQTAKTAQPRRSQDNKKKEEEALKRIKTRDNKRKEEEKTMKKEAERGKQG